ncbi:competence type IV pilus major pilin ComGC [Alkalihalobacillus alcalophilus]|nr:competence type IV pilus major pilin ComGC [Alkalihalobacillus alcalophilus]MED1562875.1 competence type IV pilus major pilin ComGC [Alkalihalobacillus alcalophilus]
MIKNERAFTLIEMLVVLMVISVLLLILVPNLTQNQSTANDKSCEATIRLVQSQVYAYQIDEGALPNDMNDMLPYLHLSSDVQLDNDGKLQCPNGDYLEIDEDGIISVVNNEDN